MGRPRTLNISPDDLLVAIMAAYNADVADVEAEREKWRAIAIGPRDADGWPYSHHHLRDCDQQLAELQTYGIAYDIPRFLRRWPSDSERITAQKRIRQMESDGLLVITGIKARFVRPTPEGIARAQELTK